MDKNKHLGGQRERRRFRVRKRIRGSSERPRLCVFRSHRNLACQIIDDASGKTLWSAEVTGKAGDSAMWSNAKQVAENILGKALTALATHANEQFSTPAFQQALAM